MACIKCNEENELVPRRRICRLCYNKEKLEQKNKRNTEEREQECTKCFQVKIIPKNKTWCKDCKNEYERIRKQNMNDDQKNNLKNKNKEYYQKAKENVKEVIIDNTVIKKCSKCNEEKTLDMFHIAKCKGTIRSMCKSCSSNERKTYYKNNREKTIKVNTAYTVSRCKTDPAFKLERTLRCRLYHALKSQAAIKKGRTLDLTSCQISYLRGYLEAKFEEGMTWENHGEWHIDHIKPCCSFDLTKEEEQKKCFHYSNLQPLWAKDNLVKGGKI